jgi:hypothetical protein
VTGILPIFACHFSLLCTIAAGVHRHRHRHVLHHEFVNCLHAQVLESDHPRRLDRLGDEVGRAAHRHQVDRLVAPDALDRRRSALGLADHAEQAGLVQHHVGEFVHAGGGGGACGADHFVAHRVDRANVVDDAVGEVNGQGFAFGQHVGNALVGRRGR